MDAISGSGSSALAGAGATSSKHQKTFRGAADEGELEKLFLRMWADFNLFLSEASAAVADCVHLPVQHRSPLAELSSQGDF